MYLCNSTFESEHHVTACSALPRFNLYFQDSTPMSTTPNTPDPPLRHTSLTPSDDSSIIELSFDYEFDSAGNYVRVSKGASSSPPTPHEGAGITRAKSALVGGSSPLLNSSPAAPRRSSLSRSESYPIMTGAEMPSSSSSSAAAATRSFQRVVSGPMSSSNVPAPGPTSTLSSLRTGAPLSNGLRGTVRKLSARAQPGPQRVTMEQYREMDEKIRLEDEEMRAGGVGREKDEKENYVQDFEGDGGGGYAIPHSQSRQQRSSGLSPRLTARSASVSLIQTQTQSQTQIPSEGLAPRITSAPIPATATAAAGSGRQIFPGPSRAGRILMGAKYASATNPSSSSTTANSSSATTTTTNSAASSSAIGAGGSGLGGFERINEVDAFEDGNELGGGGVGVLDYYGAEEGDIGMLFFCFSFTQFSFPPRFFLLPSAFIL